MNIVWIVLLSIVGILLLAGLFILIQDMLYYRQKEREDRRTK